MFHVYVQRFDMMFLEKNWETNQAYVLVVEVVSSTSSATGSRAGG